MNSKPTTYNPAEDGILAGKAEARARAKMVKRVNHSVLNPPKYIRNHSMYSFTDWTYLLSKGYTPREIQQIWDRDAKAGNEPVVWHTDAELNYQKHWMR